MFEEKAKELIELCGSPESALSKALAFATNAGAKTVDGAAALKSKYSLLAGCEDFTTFGIKSTRFAFERNPQVEQFRYQRRLSLTRTTPRSGDY